MLNGTGKFKDFQIQSGCCKSLTAIVAPIWTWEFRDVKMLFGGCESLTAIAALESIRNL